LRRYIEVIWTPTAPEGGEVEEVTDENDMIGKPW